ncbi:hypothetical protein ACTU45_36515, partial [Streptomyces sp. 24-1644]|uniref:hypothetical protein n=1 Tax=Streptomyces sp. 24-1644 TaxID=3457315 RepID=UPI003FA7625D
GQAPSPQMFQMCPRCGPVTTRCQYMPQPSVPSTIEPWQFGQGDEAEVEGPAVRAVGSLRDERPVRLGQDDAVLGLEGVYRRPAEGGRAVVVDAEGGAQSVEVGGAACSVSIGIMDITRLRRWPPVPVRPPVGRG